MVKKIAIVFIFISFVFFIHGDKALAAVDCEKSNTIITPADKSYCQSQLNDAEAQLIVAQSALKDASKTSGTLKGDINVLTAQVIALKAKVKARSLAIAQLKVSITEKVKAISSLSEKIDREHESLAQLLRNTNEFDNENISYLMLSDASVSEFYSDLESYDSIKIAVKDSVEKINGIKQVTEVQKKDLETKQNAETDAKAQLESAQKKVVQTEDQKKQLLVISKNKELSYAKLVAEKKAKADKIKSALFSLAGISQKIEFGTALSYANVVKAKTGIDPAFLLAILTQESNLGANVGRCYLSDTQTGYGTSVSTGKVWPNLMKPTRDLAPFLDITSKLSLNPLNTAVSCPISGEGGYGGAMGPAQFIPSTWIGYASRLKSVLGHDANPWNPQDAFMASGVFLTDLGAIGDSASAQSKAACNYYGSGGKSCSYSRSVMKLKASIQNNIDLLSS